MICTVKIRPFLGASRFQQALAISPCKRAHFHPAADRACRLKEEFSIDPWVNVEAQKREKRGDKKRHESGDGGGPRVDHAKPWKAINRLYLVAVLRQRWRQPVDRAENIRSGSSGGFWNPRRYILPISDRRQRTATLYTRLEREQRRTGECLNEPEASGPWVSSRLGKWEIICLTH